MSFFDKQSKSKLLLIFMIILSSTLAFADGSGDGGNRTPTPPAADGSGDGGNIVEVACADKRNHGFLASCACDSGDITYGILSTCHASYLDSQTSSSDRPGGLNHLISEDVNCELTNENISSDIKIPWCAKDTPVSSISTYFEYPVYAYYLKHSGIGLRVLSFSAIWSQIENLSVEQQLNVLTRYASDIANAIQDCTRNRNTFNVPSCDGSKDPNSHKARYPDMQPSNSSM